MHIITNTAITVDGRISRAPGKHVRFGSNEDVRLMQVIRNKADAIIVGGNSFRNWPYPLLPNPALVTPRKKIIYNVVLSNTLRFPLTRKFLSEKRMRPLFLTSRKRIPANFPCEIIRSRGEITPRWIVQELVKRGVKVLLIEGGGDIIYQFFKANLINEMYVTLCPKLFGCRGAPTVCDGAGFKNPEIRDLKLVSSRRIKGEIFLKYRATKKR